MNLRRLPPSVARAARLHCAVMLGIFCSVAIADDSAAPISDGSSVFSEQTGASLYRGICQACHMSDGQGAIGAGRYPALEQNDRLASAAYPIYNVLHGRKGMPGFGNELTNAQVAEVVNYVRTHLGNHYTDPVTAADVSKLR